MRLKKNNPKISERNFQKSLLDEWKKEGGWAENFHPSIGSTIGVPDVLFLAKSGNLVFLELKVGKFVIDRCGQPFLKCSPIRASQIRWAKKFLKAGGKVGFVCGVFQNGNWKVFVLPIKNVLEGLQRFPECVLHNPTNFDDLFCWIEKNNL